MAAKKRYTVAARKKRHTTHGKSSSLRAAYKGGKLLGIFRHPVDRRSVARARGAKWALPRLRW